MSEGTIFIFSIVNFLLLIAGLGIGLRRISRQYFYARRMLLKKEMVTSAHVLRDARLRAKKSRDLQLELQAEIARRKSAAAKSAEEEGQAIVADSKLRASRIIERAGKQGQEERLRALHGIRTSIISRAFDKAIASLKRGMNSALKNSAIAGSSDEFKRLIGGAK